jgi:hypothetical protein
MDVSPSRSPRRSPATTWLIGAALLVVIAGGAWYALRGHPSPTTNGAANANSASMMRHSDSERHYSFSAPSSWTVAKLADPKAGYSLTPGDGSKSTIYVNAIPNPTNASIQQLFSTFDDTSRLWFDRYAHSAVTINGLQAVRFAPFKESGDAVTRIEVAIKGATQVATLSYQYATDDVLATFNQVVDSLSFD